MSSETAGLLVECFNSQLILKERRNNLRKGQTHRRADGLRRHNFKKAENYYSYAL